MDVLEQIKNYIYFLIIICIVVGTTGDILYYHMFRVNIINFLTPSEILLTNIFPILKSSLLPSILFIAFIIPDPNNDLGIKSPLHLKYLIPIFIATMLLIAIIFCFISFTMSFEKALDFGVGFYFFLILIFFFFIIHIHSNKQLKEYKPMAYMILIMVIITMQFCAYSILNYISVLDGKTRGTIIEFTDGNIIKSTSWNIYIGKTDNFIFIYHPTRKITTVYKVSDVKSFEIIERSNKYVGPYPKSPPKKIRVRPKMIDIF